MNNIITVQIAEYFAGDYRLEYDGKYIKLFGKDKNYDLEGMFGAPKGTYDEIVLISCVGEFRNANPVIEKVADKEIIISINKIR